MTQSQAWFQQILSDFAAAKGVRNDRDTTTYCQAIGKYQQVVEKSIKAMVAAIRDQGIQFSVITPAHYPVDEINALNGLRRAIDPASVEQISQIFTDKHRILVRDLCGLAPQYPRDNITFRRNTEYPYNEGLPVGDWTAPASANGFTLDEVKLYYSLAWVTHRKVGRFVDTVRRRL